ncbi:MAG: ABC transporter permease [Bauldia sp.]|nr:ABC transporter permease [Bauldia sp.]
MGRIILGRLVQGAIVVFGVVVIVFVVTRLIGDPVAVMLPIEATPEQRAAFEHQLGLDRPIVVQFGDFVRGLATLEFGDSLWQRRPALEIIAERIPNTLILVFTALSLAAVLAIPLGAAAGLRPGSLADRLVVTTSLVGLSIPQFWLGLLLVVLFAVHLGWLPSSGIGGISHLVLPAVTLAMPALARLVMMVRSSMIEELNQPYVRVAEAKGMPLRRIVGVHAARNAAIPVATLIGWELIRALSGYTVVVETVFSWPGLGLTAIQAIQRQDLILLQAIVFVVAVIVVVLNVGIDSVNRIIDPRTKSGIG